MRPSINIAACFSPVYSFTAFSLLISVTSVEAFNVSADVLLCSLLSLHQNSPGTRAERPCASDLRAEALERCFCEALGYQNHFRSSGRT
uniref:Putative secreted peptide n=1 Tax=Anopheles braziliensis TaxID=58242 RepID=A0A2M3ZQH1_9DIPT